MGASQPKDTRIRTVQHLVALTGELPDGILSEECKSGYSPWMVIFSIPSPAAENYRMLRANLMFGLQDVKVVCLISAGKGDTVPVGFNLVIALTHAGQTVILTKANLHKPNFQKP